MASNRSTRTPIFWVVLFSFSSCAPPSQNHFIPKTEKKRYEEFFKTFLFIDEAVYTLYGSKPVTEIVLIPETPEERSALQDQFLKRLSKTELAKLKAESFEYAEAYWFEETWAMWEEMLKTLPIKRYLFVERKVGIPSEFQRNRYIYFFNIAETAKVLSTHYSLFREFVGFDFDPLSIVFDAKNPDSLFWNRIWAEEGPTDKSVCLMGILFGYGFENSYPFSWYFAQNKSAEETAFIASILKSGVQSEPVETLERFHPPQHCLLPGFISFSEFDPHKERYKREYERIRQIYMHADIIECTMQQLLN